MTCKCIDDVRATGRVRNHVLVPDFGPRQLNTVIRIFILRRGLFLNYSGQSCFELTSQSGDSTVA